MSAENRPDWHRVGLELAAARTAARRERRLLGRVTDRTATRVREILARASALLVIDDARYGNQK